MVQILITNNLAPFSVIILKYSITSITSITMPKKGRKGLNLSCGGARRQHNKIKKQVASAVPTSVAGHSNSPINNLIQPSQIPLQLPSSTPNHTLLDLEEEQEEEISNKKLSNKVLRCAVAACYIQTLASPPRTEWDHCSEKIMELLTLPRHSKSMVLKVLDEVERADKEGYAYDGSLRREGRKQTNMIEENSLLSNMIADLLETGTSVSDTTLIINEHLVQSNKEIVTRAAVYGVMHRLNPLITTIKKSKQGSTDKDSAWAKARLNSI